MARAAFAFPLPDAKQSAPANFNALCLLWVKSGKAQTEQMFSGLSLKADARRLWLDRFSVFDFFLGTKSPAGASRLRTADPETSVMVVG
jgi:hypothetical protein